jgi:hypothetical protein
VGLKHKPATARRSRVGFVSLKLDQLSAKSFPRMGHIGHAQIMTITESMEDIGGGLYASFGDAVKRRR